MNFSIQYLATGINSLCKVQKRKELLKYNMVELHPPNEVIIFLPALMILH